MVLNFISMFLYKLTNSLKTECVSSVYLLLTGYWYVMTNFPCVSTIERILLANGFTIVSNKGLVSDIAIFVLKWDVKLQLTNFK